MGSVSVPRSVSDASPARYDIDKSILVVRARNGITDHERTIVVGHEERRRKRLAMRTFGRRQRELDEGAAVGGLELETRTSPIRTPTQTT
jgi:hypothetical protein